MDWTEDERELDVTDELLIDLLASGYTHEEAAAVVDCSAKTVQRRKTNPRFRRALSERSADRVAALARRLAVIAGSAVDVLEAELRSGSSAVRLRAAQLLLDHCRRYNADVVVAETDERLEELESAITAMKQLPASTQIVADQEGVR